MSAPGSLLLVQFLAWVARHPRTYSEAMDAWRSTCPRHTVWEDALMDGLIELEAKDAGRETFVSLTPQGRAILDGNKEES